MRGVLNDEAMHSRRLVVGELIDGSHMRARVNHDVVGGDVDY